MNHGNETSGAEWERQREQLSALLDGELSEGERVALERHLQDCAACRRVLGELRQARALLRALPAPALPRSFTLPETGVVPDPLRATAHRPVATGASAGLARAVQRIGTLAAAVGLVLLLGSGIVGLSHGVTRFGTGGASSAPASYNSQAGGTSNQDRNTQGSPGAQFGSATFTPHAPASPAEAGGGATPTATPTHIPTPTPSQSAGRANDANGSGGGNQTPPPLVPLAGAGLLVGGAGLALAGRSARRRSERRR